MAVKKETETVELVKASAHRAAANTAHTTDGGVEPGRADEEAVDAISEAKPIKVAKAVEAKQPEAKPEPKKVFIVKGRNPFANDPAYQEMRVIFLPMARAGEQLNASIRLNGVVWQIPRGKPVEVPVPVYEQFERSLKAEAAEIELQNKMMGALSPENYGMGYKLGDEPI